MDGQTHTGLTLGANIKAAYPGSYDDIPDDQLGESVAKKYAKDAGSDVGEPDSYTKVWEFLVNPLLPEIPREAFMPDDVSTRRGLKLDQFFGEVAYQAYRGLIRPATSPLSVGMM